MPVSVRQGNVQHGDVLDFSELRSALFQTRYVHTFHVHREIDVTANEHTTLVNQAKCVCITK